MPRLTTVAPLDTKNGHKDLSSGREVPIDRLAAFSNGSVFPPFPAPLPAAAPGAEVDNELDMGRELEMDEGGAVAELLRRAEAFRVVIRSVAGGGVSATSSGFGVGSEAGVEGASSLV